AYIDDGSAGINDAGLALTHSGGTNNQYTIADLISAATSLLSLGITGTIGATLPMDFPTQGCSVGEFAVAASLAKFFEDPAGSVSLTLPDLTRAQVVALGLDAVLRTADVFLDGLDNLLGRFQDGLTNVASATHLPLIGNGLADAAGFISSFRT